MLRAADTSALLLACCLVGAMATAAPAELSGAAAVRDVRGITISTHTDGRDWAFDSMVPTMREISELGANWVSIHPYAGIRADGTVRFRSIDPANPPEHIVRPIREAHAQGLKILIKPHLAYWGSPFSWRGEIRFDDAEKRARFFREYEAWITGIARIAREADGFVVGTELDGTIEHESAWRKVIAAVRRVTPAPLTYASNWTDFERVPFWDDLDLIGIQGYFPVAGEGVTDEPALRDGWNRLLKRLRTYSERQQRLILLTELGYNRSHAAAVRPWESHTDGESARALQERCMRVALTAIDGEPAVVGSFLWKWFPKPRSVGRNFRLADPRMKAVIRGVWVDDPPAAPTIPSSR